MNFYKLSNLLKETSYDSQVVPGGQTVANQPMQQPQLAAQPAQVAEPVQAKDVNYLLKKVSSKLGNNVNKYAHLVNYLKNKPEMLDMFSQALEDMGGIQPSTYQRIAQN